MGQTITIIQIVSAIILIVLILLQNKGGGLSGIFGGAEGGGGDFRTKRGMEKKLHTFTIIFSILFLVLSLANLFVNR